MKVSVVMITYNHEQFIRQAIESVLMQETSFDYELVIGEDCSTDRTREIVTDFQRRFPDKIRLLLQDQNQGASRNFVATYMACRGEYVALLEGDDYWISPGKLQKQIDFLDQHPEYAICFHNAVTFWQDSSREIRIEIPSGQKDTIGITDILKGLYMPTGSVVLRRGLIGSFPDWYLSLRVGDTPLYLLAMLNAEEGKIKYFPELLYVHRVQSSGVWSSVNDIEKARIICELDRCLMLHLPEKYAGLLKHHLTEWEFALAQSRKLQPELFQEKGPDYADKSVFRYIMQLVAYGRLSIPNAIRWMVRLYAPSIYRLSKFIKLEVMQLGRSSIKKGKV